MKDFREHPWLWQYVVPIAILALSLWLMTNVIGTHESAISWIFWVAPILAFIIGFVFRPAWTVVSGIAALLVLEIPMVITRGTAEISELVAEFPWAMILIVLPAWFLTWAGKIVRAGYGEQPHSPAG
jgi:predicted CDP-diglyceride synthetase/phosphatidate cytidylyltransferase